MHRMVFLGGVHSFGLFFFHKKSEESEYRAGSQPRIGVFSDQLKMLLVPLAPDGKTVMLFPENLDQYRIFPHRGVGKDNKAFSLEKTNEQTRTPTLF